mgnify:CR=1 FL=1
MRIGGGGSSTAHLAGMSALWHDVDYVPEKRLETPLVQKGLEEMALPSEEHKLPEGHQDPFAKQEALFDIAAQDMERGIKGMAFLNGTTKRPVDNVLEVQDTMNATVNPTAPKNAETLTEDVQRVAHNSHMVNPNGTAEMRRVDQKQAIQREVQKRAEVGSQPLSKSNATKTSSDAKAMEAAVKAMEMGQGIGLSLMSATVAPGLDAAGQAASSEAAGAVKAAVMAKNTVDVAGNIDKHYDAHDKVSTESHRTSASKRHQSIIVDDDEW